MSDRQEGLTETEITAVRDHFAPTPTTIGETETGAKYVVAMGRDEDGEIETRTVCRERGRLGVLDTVGRPVAEGESLEAILATT